MDNYYVHYEVWGEINYPLPNFNGTTVDGLDKQVISTHILQWSKSFIHPGMKA